jgi:WD40 repeat protein
MWNKMMIIAFLTLMVGSVWAGGGGDVEPESLVIQQKPDYRIEVVTEKDEQQIERPKEVHFVSPEGKIVKRLPASEVKIFENHKDIISKLQVSGNQKYVLYHSKGDYFQSWGGNPQMFERVLLNAKGEEKWRKVLATYLVDETDAECWSEGISYDGSRIFFSFRDSLRNPRLIVYDTLGSELVSVNLPRSRGFSDIDISPDGKLLCAETGVKGESGRFIFFLDVEKKKTKILKADEWGKWSVSASVSRRATPFVAGKIKISWRTFSPEKAQGSINLSFDELPNNLSELFGGGR